MKILRRLFTRDKRGHDLRTPASPADRVLGAIWRYVPGSGGRRVPPPDRPDLLLLQMGKVASLALQDSIGRHGFNVMHCHSLSALRQHRKLDFLLGAPPTLWTAHFVMDQLVQYTALHLLVKWYQDNKRRAGRRLKVVTLTRDPVAWHRSAFIQIWADTGPAIVNWHRRRLGLAEDAPVDPLDALRRLLAEIVPVVAAAKPSQGCEAARAEAERLAAADGSPLLSREIDRLVRPLEWFDLEIRPLFGFDVLADPALAKGGVVRMENDFSELLALRYEDLAANTPEIGRFLGVTDFAVGRRNVTERKKAASEILAAIVEAFSTTEGRLLARELRNSRYGRACGYDRLD
jgi:hypothetical protein